jgi:hypothetical protein
VSSKGTKIEVAHRRRRNPKVSYYTDIFLEELRKSMENLRIASVSAEIRI